jgi:hypothetical protein
VTDGKALTRLVVLDGEIWEAGSVPPPAVAARIRNPKCWAPVEPDPGLSWGPEGMTQVGTATQAVIPAAPAGNGIPNLQEQAGGTEQSGVIPADQGSVIGRDPTEPIGQSEPTGEIVGALKPFDPGPKPGTAAEPEPEPKVEPQPEPAVEEPPAGPVEPPRSGRGASETAWRSFAAGYGVEVADDADRASIIAACRKAGVIQ